MVGSSDTTIPALMRSQLTPALEMNEFNATGTVYFAALLIIITAINSSFQMLTNAKQKIAKGNEEGNKELTNEGFLALFRSYKALPKVAKNQAVP